MTERASPSPESRHAAISRLFGRAMLSLRLFFSVSILALSVTFGDSSPKGRAIGRPVRPTRNEQSLIFSETVVPCYRGQQLRDNIPCQAVVNLDSGALLFPRHRALLVQAKSDRYANGSPSGGAGERSETERASPSPESRRTVISRFFDRAMLSLRLFLSVSVLALSVTFGDSSPKGRA